MYYDSKKNNEIPEFDIKPEEARVSPQEQPDTQRQTAEAPSAGPSYASPAHGNGATYYSRTPYNSGDYRSPAPVHGHLYPPETGHDGVNPAYYTPPIGPASQPPPPEDGRRRRSAGRTISVVAIALALIILSSSCINFFVNYELRLTQGENGLSASFIPKDERERVGGSPNDATPDISAKPSAGVAGGAAAQGPPSAPIGDGTTLTLGSPPGEDEALTMQEIYKKCVSSIVTVTANYSYGESGGTGIIMSGNGYIITNSHVVENCVSITVTTADGTEYDAAVVGSDVASDICVLKIAAAGLQPAEFGDSTVLEVGDEAFAIGNPLGQTLTMTNGIISGIDRTVQISGYSMTLLQTSAPINSGNSGGPLINIYGQVIGVTNAKLTSYYTTVEGIGFAIPISTTKAIVDELIDNGKIVRPVIGISVMTVDATLSAYYDMPVGVVISSVTAGTDADKKGLAEGDLIKAINGIDVSTSDELRAVVSEHGVGDVVTLTIERGGETFDVQVEIVDGSDFD